MRQAHLLPKEKRMSVIAFDRCLIGDGESHVEIDFTKLFNFIAFKRFLAAKVYGNGQPKCNGTPLI